MFRNRCFVFVAGESMTHHGAPSLRSVFLQDMPNFKKRWQGHLSLQICRDYVSSVRHPRKVSQPVLTSLYRLFSPASSSLILFSRSLSAYINSFSLLCTYHLHLWRWVAARIYKSLHIKLYNQFCLTNANLEDEKPKGRTETCR
jgi:hypothetical protein